MLIHPYCLWYHFDLIFPHPFPLVGVHFLHLLTQFSIFLLLKAPVLHSDRQTFLSVPSASLYPSASPVPAVLPFLNKFIRDARFPSGLEPGETVVILDHTLERRLVPSAFVRGG